MNLLYGVFCRFGHFSQETIKCIMHQMATCEGDERAIWLDDSCGLGQIVNTASDDWQKDPLSFRDDERNLAFVGYGRLDNREELCAALGLDVTQRVNITDSLIIRHAYYKWGGRCAERLFGDWLFVAWHPAENRLFLARDHFGIVALYYYVDKNVFVFATSRQALLALKFIPTELDELYLAQVLTCWPAYHGERTVHLPIRRLPPAHHLDVTSDRIVIQQYWFLEKTPELHLSRREDYITTFRELFDAAVKVRLQPLDYLEGTQGQIASCLSGGLDSSAVTATAAKLLAGEGRRVAAYTSVPMFDTTSFTKDRFGDELPLAEVTAFFSGNIDITTIDAAECTPVQGIKKMLQICNEPIHAAANIFWMLALRKAVQANSSKILLIGACGNAGVSWAGDIFSQSVAFQLRQLGWNKWTKEILKRNMPPSLLAIWRRRRIDMDLLCRTSAINPAFARRLNIFERRFNDPAERFPRTSLDLRSFIQPGRSMFGALQAELGGAFGLQVRDPTADVRLLEFTFSVPDYIFIDPKTGMDRWLIREAMSGRLHDDVRLNRTRGRQAGDLVPRLRASAGEVEAALNELARGLAAEYVDVPYMRQVWQMIQAQDTPEAFDKSVTILTRGIMAGLFVNGFYK